MVARADAIRRASAGDGMRLSLMGGFRLTAGQRPVRIPFSCKRVIAMLAVHPRPVRRLFVAGMLWIDHTEARARGNLRTALWQTRAEVPRLIESDHGFLALSPAVQVDTRSMVAAARGLTSGDQVDPAPAAAEVFQGELLPDWYEDWVVEERERLRQLQLHALETLTRRLAAEGRLAEAVQAGLAAVRMEPLRESAHRALIEVYVAEGNVADALRQGRFYRELLRAELGLEPSALMVSLMRTLRPGWPARPRRRSAVTRSG